jgi:hypothetical protein
MSTSFFDVLLQMGGSATLLAFVAAGLMLAGMSGLKRLRRRSEARITEAALPQTVTPTAMLDTLEKTRFAARPALDPEEMRILRCLTAWERRQSKGYRLLFGMPLGAVVAPDGADMASSRLPTLGALLQVRTDFIVIDKTGNPVLGIDLPGRAGGDTDAAREAALRQITFDKVRLPLIAPETGTTGADVVAQVDRKLGTGLIRQQATRQAEPVMEQVA